MYKLKIRYASENLKEVAQIHVALTGSPWFEEEFTTKEEALKKSLSYFMNGYIVQLIEVEDE